MKTIKCARCKEIENLVKYENLSCQAVCETKGVPYTFAHIIGCWSRCGDYQCDCYSTREINKLRGDPCNCITVRPSKKKDHCVWATVSPAKNVDFKKFFVKCKRYLKSTCFSDKSWMCFEWRHNGSENEGLHVHMWLRKGKGVPLGKFNEIACEKYWVKKGFNRQAMKWFKPCNFPEEDKLSYCKGTTWEDDKSRKKQLLDKKKRYLLAINDIIYRGDITQ